MWNVALVDSIRCKHYEEEYRTVMKASFEGAMWSISTCELPRKE